MLQFHVLLPALSYISGTEYSPAAVPPFEIVLTPPFWPHGGLEAALGVEAEAWSHGRVVSAVLPGGPADREGTLQPGDVLLEASPLPLPAPPRARSASSAAPARSSRGSARGGGRRGGPAGGAARSGSRASTSASQRMTIC